MLHRHAGRRVAAAFALGSTAGAVVTAAGLAVVAGLVSPVSPTARATVAAALFAAIALHALGVVRLPLPERRWQIPQQVFHGPPTHGARRFGFELGTGVRTYVTDPSPYALAAALVLVPSPGWQGLAEIGCAAIGFGLGRSIVIATTATSARVAVDHPPVWLRLAGWASIATCATMATRMLVG